MQEPSEIQKLLRLKRYEQPPEGHTDVFLKEFQRRQRNVLLEHSSWRIGLERLQVSLREWGFANFLYAGATAGLLVFAGITATSLFDKNSPLANQTAPAQPVQSSGGETARFALDGRGIISLPGLEAVRGSARPDESRPRYVIDARPVSYELPASF